MSLLLWDKCFLGGFFFLKKRRSLQLNGLIFAEVLCKGVPHLCIGMPIQRDQGLFRPVPPMLLRYLFIQFISYKDNCIVLQTLTFSKRMLTLSSLFFLKKERDWEREREEHDSMLGYYHVTIISSDCEIPTVNISQKITVFLKVCENQALRSFKRTSLWWNNGCLLQHLPSKGMVEWGRENKAVNAHFLCNT